VEPGRNLPSFRIEELNPFSPLTRVHGVMSGKTVFSTPVVFYVKFVVTSSLRVYPFIVILQEVVNTLPQRCSFYGIMEMQLHLFLTLVVGINYQLHA